jgi:NhaP-type Na+/H+ or K+/H+ antiporter
VSGEVAQRLTGLTLTTVAVSVAVHGISVTPLMKLYEEASRRQGRGRAEGEREADRGRGGGRG